MESADGHLWVATDGSLNVFDPTTGNFDIRRLTDSTGRHNANWAYGMVEDTVTHSLWTGAYLGGVLVADSRTIAAAGAPAVATRAYNSSNGLAGDLVSSIAQDSRRNKWVLLFRDSCLTRFDARTGAMSRTDISRAAGGRAPVMIAAGPDGRLWCAFAGGVVPINHRGTPGRAIFLPGTDADAVPEALGNVNGCLWMSESSGRVWSIDPRTAAARLLPLPPARYTSIYYDPQLRRVLLGTTDAIVAADPRRLAATGTDTLRIAGVNRLGQPEAPGTRRITLPFGTNSLSVELATFNFSSLAARHPAYRLADLDSAWTVLPDGSNTVLLRNIPEGRHRLEVRLLDAGGAPVVFDVRVMPPWHRSWWAMALYVLAAAGAILTLLMVLRRRQKRRIEGIRRSNAIQNVGSRLDFLANIAHDFKTPLSMIIGPLSRLRDSTGLPSDADVRRSVETAYQNALRLNNMVHHSVEYDRAEAQASSPMIYSQIDAAEFCRNIVNRFAEAYPAMTFSFRAEPERIPAVADAIKLESILTNLLSNAMKYAGPKAAVEVVADGADGKMLHLSVTDNGPGIDARCQRLVFQRLFRAPDTACEAEGTGIGLYLVRRYAQQHHGDVELLSPVADGHGARFTVTLPLSAGTEGAHAGAGAPESDASPDDKRPRILVVDDNRQIAEFLTDLLGDQYRCAVAHDGRAGLELIPAFRPDLVIADEMMPVMTGTEMCRRLRASGSAGASVPVIILSAKTDPELERDTVRAGADLLITKPFDAPLLRERVARIIAARDARRRDARVEAITNRPAPDTDALESDSERRLAAVTDFIEANISDPQLNVALVCQRTGMQSKSLYRLVKNLTGLSPVDYIRQTRLRRAALLLGQKRFTVSEVMYMVGFSSPSYFSKCFTAMYGVRPSQYETPPEAPSQSD